VAGLRSAGIIRKGWDKGDRTGHFVVDLAEAMNQASWGIEDAGLASQSIENAGPASWGIEEAGHASHGFEEAYLASQEIGHCLLGDGGRGNLEEEGLYARVNKSETPLHHTCSPLHKAVERVPKEVLEALTHTTWYRQAGPTKVRYVLAIAIIDAALEGGATSTKIAEAVEVRPTSVSRPLKELREAGVVHQDEPRGPYRVDEKVAEALYGFRSDRGEFLRDEVAEKKARDQRRFFRYQTELKYAILGFLEKGSDPDHSLEEARKIVSPPRGMKEHERYNRQDWALGQARREHERSQGGNRPKRAGRARGADGDARVLRDMREGYFRGGGKDGDG
jgi:DNA-binding transcriptional ArsR family regulator